MNQTVLITGCSSGFGKLTAQTFHSEGWNVAATMRSPEKETELADGDRMLVLKLDVTDTASVAAAVAAARARFGRVDAVVNNAGYGGHGLFEQASGEDVRAMFESNVFGPMNVMREALPEMRAAGGGAIVNVTSMAGHLGLPGNAVYTASKHAMIGLTEAMALEYKLLGVRIYSVPAGSIQQPGSVPIPASGLTKVTFNSSISQSASERRSSRWASRWRPAAATLLIRTRSPIASCSASRARPRYTTRPAPTRRC